MRVPAELVDFILDHGGFLATRDAHNRPTAVEASVVGLAPETGMAEIAANARFARRMPDNIRDNGVFAMSCTRPFGDHRSVQLKGQCLDLQGPMDAAERLARSIGTLHRALHTFGVPQRVIDDYGRVRFEPSWLLRVRIDEVFDQTPGPSAGKALA
jgi:hypothetical protein